MFSLVQGQYSDMNSPAERRGDDSSRILTCDTVEVLLFPSKTTNISILLKTPTHLVQVQDKSCIKPSNLKIHFRY